MQPKLLKHRRKHRLRNAYVAIIANTINTDVVSLSTHSDTQLVCCSLVRQEKTCSFFKNLYLCGWSRVDFLGGHLTSEAASNDVPGRSLFQNITSSPWSFFCVSCENTVDVLPQKIRLNPTPVEFLFFWSSCLVGLCLLSVFWHGDACCVRRLRIKGGSYSSCICFMPGLKEAICLQIKMQNSTKESRGL